MTINLNAYLTFQDQARAAMEFYQSVFGGELTMTTFKEFNVSSDPAEDDKVMHSQLAGDNGIVFMASDTPNSMTYQPGTNFNLSLSGDDEPVLRGYFDQLAAGGVLVMPAEPAPWGDIFGMCTDKFGVNWLVNISPTA